MDSADEFAQKKYPGASSHGLLKNIATEIHSHDKQGIRITQERDVSYIGSEGVEEKHEVDCVYIQWDRFDNFVLHLIQAKQAHLRNNNE